MRNVRFSKLELCVLVLLFMSIVLNICQYFNAIGPSSKDAYGSTILVLKIQGGMGNMHISIGTGIITGLGARFNISVGVKLWEPYAGSATYNVSFRLYVRSEQDDKYSDVPMAEKTVIAQKDKDSMYVVLSSGNLTANVPDTRGIYVYKVEFGPLTDTWETFEFPLLAEEGMLLSPIV